MTNKVVYKTQKEDYIEKKIVELNFISSFIIFDLSNLFFVDQTKSRKFV